MCTPLETTKQETIAHIAVTVKNSYACRQVIRCTISKKYLS